MILVADCSALIALSICNRLELLDQIFAQVLVPEAVYDEATQPNKKQASQLKIYLKDGIVNYVELLIFICLNKKAKKYKTYRKLTMPKLTTKETTMQAYYEIETNIPSNHQLQIQLPDSIPVGRAKIAIIYEFVETQNHAGSALNAFLNTYQTKNTEDLITAIKKFRVNKSLSAQDIKLLCEEGRSC